MKVSRSSLVFLAALVLAGCSRCVSCESITSVDDDPTPIPVRDDPPIKPFDLVLSNDQAIQVFETRAKADPKDCITQTLLAQMYIRKARDLSDFAGYDRAETATRRALELNPAYGPAQVNVALIHCARHEFKEGLALAQRLYAQNPDAYDLLAVIGDAHLELGNYALAEKAYQELESKDSSATSPTRYARLEELKGNTQKALLLMQSAANKEREGRVAKEGGAWFQARIGEMHFNAGRQPEAERHYEASLKEYAGYYVALAGLGRVRAAQGKYPEAIELYKKAVAITATLPLLAELGDLYCKTGNDYLARLCYEKLERAGTQQAAFARELSLYYSDHDLKPAEALALAQKDLQVRKDIYAYDALAWALCRNKRYEEAATAMADALKLGTLDANLYYHAGRIALGAGKKEQGRQYLSKALAMNPSFSLRHAAEAQRLLKE